MVNQLETTNSNRSQIVAKSARDAHLAVTEGLDKLGQDLLGDDYVRRGGLTNRKSKLREVPRSPYFRLGRNTDAVDNYSEGESGSEFPVKFKSLKRSR